MKRLIIGMVALAISLNAMAGGEECSSVIALSKVVQTSSSDQSEVQQSARDFCSEYQKYRANSNSANFGASYKFLSASFGSSSASVDQVASRYCSAENSYAAKTDAYKAYVEQIAPGAYDAYAMCLASSNQDVRYKINPGSILPEKFSMVVSFTSSQGLSDTTVQYSSSDDVSCLWDSNSSKKKFTVKTGTSTSLECSRKSSAKASYVQVSWAGSGSGNSPLVLPWPAYKDGVPVDSLRQISQQVQDIATQLTGVSKGLSNIAYESGAFDISAVGTRPLDDSSQCPSDSNAWRGNRNGRVNFTKTFSAPPTVAAAISELDAQGGSANDSIRISLSVTSVDAKGFNYNFTTWCTTKIWGTKASWIAVSK